MKKLLCILTAITPVACAPAPSYPAEPISLVYDSPDVTVRLFRDGCDTAKVALPAHMVGARRAAVTWQGKPFVACWSLLGADVLIVDETGDAGTLPVVGFKPEESL